LDGPKHHRDSYLSNVPTRGRIALYSPGMIGLGHMRRNLLIAQIAACRKSPDVILLIAEAREASAFKLPPGVDCLTLPGLRKELDGLYAPRYLNLPAQELIELRAHVIQVALEEYRPDLLIVDHLPRGAGGELEPTLESLRGSTRCILGLRDILGDPATIRAHWCNPENQKTIERYFDAIWIYGDPFVYDSIREYNLPLSIARKIEYMGYLDQRRRLDYLPDEQNLLERLNLPPGRLVLCLVGGGQDGFRLAEAFAKAPRPSDLNAVIVTGPFMSEENKTALQAYAVLQKRLRILHFVPELASLLQHADYVIAMGGYNTICEILSYEKTALIVPRNKRAPEQQIRAERLLQLGLIDLLSLEDLTSAKLSDWLFSVNGHSPPRAREVIDMKGLDRVTAKLNQVLTEAAFSSLSTAKT